MSASHLWCLQAHPWRMQIHFSGNSSLEGAINWVEEHAEDADIDTMLLVEKKDAVRFAY